MMNRRSFLGSSSCLLLGTMIYPLNYAQAKTIEPTVNDPKWQKTNTEWKKILTPEQYYILREEGTERAFSSSLTDEKRKGTFVCVACALPLFSSSKKYDSGTGWPSFFDAIPHHLATKDDFELGYKRTEYHCARCKGHQGHVFNDGPKPTGLRYCNNGLALKFLPSV